MKTFSDPRSFFSQNDQKFMYEHVISKLDNPVAIAEIGNLTGVSTRFFSQNLPEAHLYSIDKFQHKLPPLDDNVEVIISDSTDWEPPCWLDFVYLDGDHSVEKVTQELKHYSQHTDIIAGHDIFLVTLAVFDFFKTVPYRAELQLANNCASWVMKLHKKDVIHTIKDSSGIEDRMHRLEVMAIEHDRQREILKEIVYMQQRNIDLIMEKLG